MQINELKKEGLSREYNVVILSSDVADKISAKLKEVAVNFQMPGFRKGKVPTNMIMKQKGSYIKEEVAYDIKGSALDKILADNDNIKIAGYPKFNNKSELEEGKNFEFNISFDTFPEISEIKLDEIKINKLKVKISDEDIQNHLNDLSKINKKWNDTSEDHVAKNGDAVVIDFEGYVDGEKFEGGSAEKYTLELGSARFIPGFEEQLIGSKAGEDRLVKVKFPENYGSPKLAGKDSEFKIKVHKVQEASATEYNDEFAKAFGIETIDQLRDKIKERIESEVSSVIRMKMKKQLFDKIDSQIVVELPDSIVDAEYKGLLSRKDVTQELGESGSEVSEETKQKLKSIAIRRVKLALIVDKISKQNNISVTSEDVRKGILERARQYPGHEQKIVEIYQKNRSAVDSIKGEILEDKVVDFLFDKTIDGEIFASVEELEKFATSEDI